MPFLVCMKCVASCSIDTHEKPMRPMYCGPDAEGNLIACEWLEPPTRIQKRKQVPPHPGAPMKADNVGGEMKRYVITEEQLRVARVHLDNSAYWGVVDVLNCLTPLEAELQKERENIATDLITWRKEESKTYTVNQMWEMEHQKLQSLRGKP